MPIYEYICNVCQERHEALQKISDAPLKRCPHCRKEGLEKQISAASFRLSGSGWYETDFKTKNQRNLAGDKGKPVSEKGGKDASGSKPSSDKTNKPVNKSSSADKTKTAQKSNS